MSPREIRVVDWRHNFFAALEDILLEDFDLSATTVIFPHHRPARYLLRRLAESERVAKPLIVPETSSYPDFIARLRLGLTDGTVRRISRLDQVGLLYDIVNSVRDQARGMLADLPLERERFFPWGLRLADLLEELLRQDVRPRNLQNMQGEVMEFAAALLQEIGTIHEAYLDGLARRGWTTFGLDSRWIMENLETALESLAGRRVLIAGYYALSGSEEALFSRLWRDDDATVVWHSDPALATGEPTHFAAAEHVSWLGRWKAKARGTSECSGCSGPRVRFYEGFDLHSQLKAMAEEMESGSLEDTALILPRTNHLQPVLHHLPERDVNISMGYPLERTALAQLVETIIALQTNRLDDGRCYWRDMISLVTHPFLKMLSPAGDRTFRRALNAWESKIRRGRKHLDPLEFRPEAEDVGDEDPTLAASLLDDVRRAAIEAFASLRTLAELAEALHGFCALLRDAAPDVWHAHLLDAECLHRLMTSIIPQLANSHISHERFGPEVLFSVLRELLRAERVSFEPEPLTGLQVIGFLESRLLSFRRLFILDATEENLPGVPEYTPLLPDPLRHLLGLPDIRQRAGVAAHNFHRLLQGAEEAVIFYSSGVSPGIFDSKSVRSRFVEQLLWDEELKRGALLEPEPDATEDHPLRAVHMPINPIPPRDGDIIKSDALRDALRDHLTRRGLTPSQLDAYLWCPARFFYQFATRVRPLDEINEEGDRAGLGTVVHQALEDFLRPHLGRPLDADSLSPDELVRTYRDLLEEEDFYRQMSLDMRIALREAGERKLTAFVRNLPETRIRQLEGRLDRIVSAEGLEFSLRGTFDRLDERDGGLILLDYKTGKVREPKKGFWQDEELWESMEGWSPERDDPDLLPRLAEALGSVQLPMYLFMHAAQSDALPGNAGYVSLAGDGKEMMLLEPDTVEAERVRVLEDRIPVLMEFALGHLLRARNYTTAPGPRCGWCPYAGACGAGI